MVAAADALIEPQSLQQVPQFIEVDVRIGLPLEDSKPEFLLVLRNTNTLTYVSH
jgi:hypothetical protein